MATAMNCGASEGRAPSVLGRSSFRLVVISGAVIMKITSSTSITSISGVMLMSLIGREPGLRSRRPKAMAQDSMRWWSSTISRRSCAKPSSSASQAPTRLPKTL